MPSFKNVQHIHNTPSNSFGTKPIDASQQFKALVDDSIGKPQDALSKNGGELLYSANDNQTSLAFTNKKLGLFDRLRTRSALIKLINDSFGKDRARVFTDGLYKESVGRHLVRTCARHTWYGGVIIDEKVMKDIARRLDAMKGEADTTEGRKELKAELTKLKKDQSELKRLLNQPDQNRYDKPTLQTALYENKMEINKVKDQLNRNTLKTEINDDGSKTHLFTASKLESLYKWADIRFRIGRRKSLKKVMQNDFPTKAKAREHEEQARQVLKNSNVTAYAALDNNRMLQIPITILKHSVSYQYTTEKLIKHALDLVEQPQKYNQDSLKKHREGVREEIGRRIEEEEANNDNSKKLIKRFKKKEKYLQEDQHQSYKNEIDGLHKLMELEQNTLKMNEGILSALKLTKELVDISLR